MAFGASSIFVVAVRSGSENFPQCRHSEVPLGNPHPRGLYCPDGQDRQALPLLGRYEPCSQPQAKPLSSRATRPSEVSQMALTVMLPKVTPVACACNTQSSTTQYRAEVPWCGQMCRLQFQIKTRLTTSADTDHILAPDRQDHEHIIASQCLFDDDGTVRRASINTLRRSVEASL
eukprot:6025370-Prymnesium_polylepis.2